MSDLENIYAAPKSDLKRLDLDLNNFKKTIKYAKFLFRCMIIYAIVFGLFYLPMAILNLTVFSKL